MALHEAMLVPAFMHCSVVIVWKEKERLRSMDVQMGSFRVLLGIREMDKTPNAWISEL